MDRDLPDWVAAARAQLPVTGRCAYLNTGTAGPVPLPAAEAATEAARADLEQGRGNFAGIFAVFERRERVRAQLARLLSADPDEIALLQHTSEGVNLVLAGIDWRPGDKVITCDLEHDAVMVPLGLVRARYGVELVVAEAGRGERAEAAVIEALQGGARLVVLSHVVYSSGALLPIEAIAKACREAGVWLLVDGAQTCGVLPLDLSAMGADFYTVSGQKWLCGPEGSGALYVRRGLLEHLRPIHGSYFSAKQHDFRGHVLLHDSARRYETGMIHRPVLAGLEASLDWLLGIGLERIWQRSLELAGHCRQALGRLAGVELVTPAGLQGPLVSFDLPAFSPARLHGLAFSLSADGIVIRSIDHSPYCLRASLGFFNTTAEIERLAAAIARAIELGPQAVALTGWAAKLPDRR